MTAPHTTKVYRLLIAALGVWTTRFLLRTVGFNRTIQCMGNIPRIGDARNRPDPKWPAEIAFVNGKPFGATCLDRSVFLWFLLHQHGIGGHLRIGVATNEQNIDGHAWVEHEGTVLNDKQDIATDYAVFDEDPAGIVFR